MQANSEYERMADEINSRFLKTRDFGCVRVGDGELKARAAEMASRGYAFNAASLDALKAYLEGYGLLLSGDVGTGKTCFFAMLGGIAKVSMLDLYANRLDDIVDDIGRMKDKEIVVDDIGAETEYSNYGCKMDILPWLIEKRSESRKRTHFTTNLTMEDLVKRYGARVVDRIYETCKAFKFAGRSKRETIPNAEFVDASRIPGDWTLCLERCANCAAGRGCTVGIATPPQDDKAHPHPPDECAKFRALETK